MVMKKTIIASFATLLFTVALSINLYSQNSADTLVYNRVTATLNLAENVNKPINEKMIVAAISRLETPYVAGTLEQVPEVLVINIKESDCILFVESCLALALNSNSKTPSFENFTNIIKDLRYRDGVVDGYASRIHYSSEWIQQGEKNGYFKEITSELGGKPYNQTFSFMGTHPKLYKQLASDQKEVEKIISIEKRLNNSADYYVIAKEDVPSVLSKLKSGDIIGFNCSAKGLDIAHIALVYKNGDNTTFIHASMGGMKVMVEPGDIASYINKVKSNNGIRIIRTN